MPNLHTAKAYKTCTVEIIAGFGEEETAYTSIKPDGKWSESSLRDAIIDELNANRLKAMVVAYTTQNQTIANEVLKDLGFQHTRWCSKEQHEETQLRMWWFSFCNTEIPTISQRKDK